MNTPGIIASAASTVTPFGVERPLHPKRHMFRVFMLLEHIAPIVFAHSSPGKPRLKEDLACIRSFLRPCSRTLMFLFFCVRQLGRVHATPRGEVAEKAEPPQHREAEGSHPRERRAFFRVRVHGRKPLRAHAGREHYNAYISARPPPL